MAIPPKRPDEEEDLSDFETQLLVAWPGPADPPPRPVRLPGLRIAAWPQNDGSVLYEIKYRGAPYSGRRRHRAHRDTQSMTVPWDTGKKDR